MVVAFLILPNFLAAQATALLHRSKLAGQIGPPPLFRLVDKLTPPGRTALGNCHGIVGGLT